VTDPAFARPPADPCRPHTLLALGHPAVLVESLSLAVQPKSEFGDPQANPASVRRRFAE
jgi:hypothetical protein